MPVANANEDIGGSFLLTRTGDTSKALPVTLQIKGSAADGQDYQLLATTTKIKPGKATRRLFVYPANESFAPGAKRTVKIVLQPGAGYTVGSPATAKVKIFYDR